MGTGCSNREVNVFYRKRKAADLMIGPFGDSIAKNAACFVGNHAGCLGAAAVYSRHIALVQSIHIIHPFSDMLQSLFLQCGSDTD